MDAYSVGAPVQWAPVHIGDQVWMPNAWVNPGVRIGDRVIVSARSLVNRDIPSGALAGGVPAKVLKEHYLPRSVPPEEKRRLVRDIVEQAWRRHCAASNASGAPDAVLDGETLHCAQDVRFDLDRRIIGGPVTPWSEMLKDQLRRNGIRFRYSPREGIWTAWRESRCEI